MLDSIYHMTTTLKSHFWRKGVIILSLCTQLCYGRHNITRKSILLHGVISLPDAASYDKIKSLIFCRLLTNYPFCFPFIMMQTLPRN